MEWEEGGKAWGLPFFVLSEALSMKSEGIIKNWRLSKRVLKRSEGGSKSERRKSQKLEKSLKKKKAPKGRKKGVSKEGSPNLENPVCQNVVDERKIMGRIRFPIFPPFLGLDYPIPGGNN